MATPSMWVNPRNSVKSDMKKDKVTLGHKSPSAEQFQVDHSEQAAAWREKIASGNVGRGPTVGNAKAGPKRGDFLAEKAAKAPAAQAICDAIGQRADEPRGGRLRRVADADQLPRQPAGVRGVELHALQGDQHERTRRQRDRAQRQQLRAAGRGGARTQPARPAASRGASGPLISTPSGLLEPTSCSASKCATTRPSNTSGTAIT